MNTFFLCFALGAAAGAIVPPELKAIGSLGVGGAIAASALWYYRVDRLASDGFHKSTADRYDKTVADTAERFENLTNRVVASLEKTSETNARLATLIESDHRRQGGA